MDEIPRLAHNGATMPSPAIDDEALTAALARFGHRTLRAPQARAVRATLDGRDVVLLAPTGGGKSLAYQLPAVVLAERGDGATLVVSPLVALMDDQVHKLRARGIAAAAIHRDVPARERDQTLRTLRDHALVYVSPERLRNARFRSALRRGGIARLAVDEAHCISEWGHDFRPDYLQLGALREELGVPVLATTATATPRVLSEIGTSLALHEPLVVRTPMARDNLALAVELHTGDLARTRRVAALLEARGLGRDPDAGRAVIYAATRARTVSVAKALRQAGFAVAHYHAGRTAGARSLAADGFADGRKPVMVATTAFGMGIDHPDVRLVVHVQAPGTLEALAQQVGRAGRDGAPSDAVLLYAPGDAVTQARLRGTDPHPGAVAGWAALQDLVYGTGCRMVALARHFGDPDPAPCGRCDACRDRDAVDAAVSSARAAGAARARDKADKARQDRAVVLDDAQREGIVAFVDALKRPVGKRLVAQGLRGGRSKRAVRLGLPNNPQFGTLRGVPEAALVAAIEALLDEGVLAGKGRKYPTVWLPDKRVRTARPRGTTPAGGLRGALRAMRQREARRRRWKPYQVFPDATLDGIVAALPATPEALLAVPGMGPTRLEKFGGPILALVRQHGAAALVIEPG